MQGVVVGTTLGCGWKERKGLRPQVLPTGICLVVTESPRRSPCKSGQVWVAGEEGGKGDEQFGLMSGPGAAASSAICSEAGGGDGVWC